MKQYVYDGLNQFHFCTAVMFSQAIFYNRPQTFYRIEVWQVDKPFEYFHFRRLEILCNNLGVVAWAVPLLRGGQGGRTPLTTACAPHFGMLRILF